MKGSLNRTAVYSIHLTKHCFQKNNVPLLVAFACSPDLYPIDNVWGWMGDDVYENGCRFQTSDALLKAIMNTWSDIITSRLETLILVVSTQIFEVINKSKILYFTVSSI
ncbi:hypothetical protein ILYODFUR_016628 [Ilyodon furcidens]|uniref:Uncharacterized protein n=1 Tax=Ilyodon furcidens TaxID=33524 RepID=A0ABV0U6A0_9TELE